MAEMVQRTKVELEWRDGIPVIPPWIMWKGGPPLEEDEEVLQVPRRRDRAGHRRPTSPPVDLEWEDGIPVIPPWIMWKGGPPLEEEDNGD